MYWPIGPPSFFSRRAKISTIFVLKLWVCVSFFRFGRTKVYIKRNRHSKVAVFYSTRIRIYTYFPKNPGSTSTNIHGQKPATIQCQYFMNQRTTCWQTVFVCSSLVAFCYSFVTRWFPCFVTCLLLACYSKNRKKLRQNRIVLFFLEYNLWILK